MLVVVAKVALAGLILAAAVAALSRHKKAGTGDLKVVGSSARVEKKLDPQGTVLVRGELWCARSSGPRVLEPNHKVVVVGTRDHLLVVEPEA